MVAGLALPILLAVAVAVVALLLTLTTRLLRRERPIQSLSVRLDVVFKAVLPQVGSHILFPLQLSRQMAAVLAVAAK